MAAATDRVSSPPIATRPSTPLPRSRLMTCSTPPFSLRGLVREVPRMVPPSGRMPRTDADVRSSMSPAPSTPAQPFLMPVTWNPCWKARRATPRMAALRPGASPPPVRTPIRTTPSVVRLPRSAAARGEIEHEHEGAQGNDERPEDDARADGAPRGQRDEEDQDAGGDDEERPAIVPDVDPHELARQQDRPDQDEQPAENHRRASRAARGLANDGSLGAARAACGRYLGHAPTLRGPRLPSRDGARPWPERWMTGRR